MRSRPRRPKGAPGFTLIEVLVAFAVAAIVLVPLLRIFTSGLGALGSSERAATAALWAQSVLEGRGGETPLAIGIEGSELPGGYRWQRAVATYSDPGLTAQLAPLIPYAVTMTVSWLERGREHAVTLQTLRLAPPPQVQAQ